VPDGRRNNRAIDSVLPAQTEQGMDLPVPDHALAGPLSEYRKAVDIAFSPAGIAVWPEEQLKLPVASLLSGSAIAMQIDGVAVYPEAPVEGVGRPDLGVVVGGLLCGYVELKARGKGAQPDRFKERVDRAQWARFRNLPNLIYSDGEELALYRTGERVGDVLKVDNVKSHELDLLLRDFFDWQPVAPRGPAALAQSLAPLCRLLRDEVMEALSTGGKNPIKLLRKQWERTLLVTRTPEDFADEYAQTITYALLLGKAEGADALDIDAVASVLDGENDLLAEVLRVLGQPKARAVLEVPTKLLQRAIARVDARTFSAGPRRVRGDDPWLYFYEDFLEEYDPERRKKYGVYYTPVPVVQCQVRLVSELLTTRFNRPNSYLDDVVLLDPAVGTGSYPLAALTHAAQKVAESFGAEAAGERVDVALDRIYAFERFVGPYAIAHLRLAQLAGRYGADLQAANGTAGHVLLADTLADPDARTAGQAELFSIRLSEESQEANRLKRELAVFVCIGNPPYQRSRDTDGMLGSWVRTGRPDLGQPGLIDDFVAPLRAANRASQANTLAELSVYFWRWAIWKVLEQKPVGPGIISFISPKAYIAGPGHAGMRQVMRDRFDEMWIIDLGGDNRAAEAEDSQNVFAIETGVCITIGMRLNSPLDKPAIAHYAKLSGRRNDKLEALDAITAFADLEWKTCLDGPMDPFLPKSSTEYGRWPDIRDLAPWQISGAQFKRTWPIAESRELLERRWKTLLSYIGTARAEAFVETRDRLVATPGDPRRKTMKLTGIAALDSDAPCPEIIPYAYRVLDRQWALYDSRLGDFIRRSLYDGLGPQQVFFSTLMTKGLGPGPSFAATELLPDMDFFCNRGAADIIPMLGPNGPNVTAGLLDALKEHLGDISAEDLFGYLAGILGSPHYQQKFASDLVSPGPRIPITKDRTLFLRAVEIGRKFVWFQTAGWRWTRDDATPGELPDFGIAVEVPISRKASEYPEQFSYDPVKRALLVGTGVISGVAPEVWTYEQSRWQVVPGWLGYRMKTRAGKAGASVLNAIRPASWTFTEDLLRLLRQVHGCVSLWDEMAAVLEEVTASDCFSAEELPEASEPDLAAEALSDQGTFF
jgi:Type ISP C-terminal specificity domain/N-6 DNA Methylase